MTAQDPLKFTSFLTEQAEDKWQSVIVTPFENYTDYPYKGRLFGVLSLSNESQKVDCISIGEILKDFMIDSFYETDEPNIIDLLEETIHKTKNQLSEMIRQSSVIGNEVVDMECVLVSVRDNVFYSAAFGDSDVVLFNRNKKINLVEFFKDTSGRNGVKVMSGILKNEDKLLLSITKSLNRVIETKLLTHIHEFDLTNLIPSNKSNLHSCVLLAGFNLSGIVSSKHVEKHEVKEVELPDIDYEEVPEEIRDVKNVQNPIQKTEPKSAIEQETTNNDDTQDLEDTTVKPNKEVWNEKTEPIEEFEGGPIEDPSPKPVINDAVARRKALNASNGVISKLKGIFSKENQTTVFVIIRKLLSFIKRILIRIRDSISRLVFSRRKVGQIYVRKGKSPNKILPLVVVVGIIVIVIVLVLGARQISQDNEEKAKTKQASDILTEATTLSTQARDNATVNRVRSKELLAQATQKITQAETYGKFKDELNALKTKNTETQNIIEKIITIKDTNIFLDLGLKFPGSKATSFGVTGDKVIVVDSKKQAYISSKTNPDFNKVALEDSRISGIDAITTDINGNIIMFDSKNGLFTYSLTSTKIDKLAGLSDVVVGPVKAMTSYKGGGTEYLYTLRNDNSSIYKLAKVASGYTQPEVRLTDDAFATGSDIDIDGKIWVTTANRIYRYSGSNEEKYLLDKSGAPSLPKTFSKIAINSQYVFVADNTNKRVLIFTKGASNDATKIDYVASVSYEGVYGKFGDIIDLKVDGDKLYVLDSNRVYLFQVVIPDTFK
ncbi:MAG: hypothetical protein WCO33_02820 [bacterium]